MAIVKKKQKTKKTLTTPNIRKEMKKKKNNLEFLHILGSHLVVSLKVKHATILCFSNSTLRYLPKRDEKVYLYNILYETVLSPFFLKEYLFTWQFLVLVVACGM